MSRDFTASNYNGTLSRNLRLNPQPIFRFGTNERDQDGAMFIWFDDWDPELIMIFEVRKAAQIPKWHVGFARYSNLMVSAKHRDKEIWSFSPSAAEPPLGTKSSAYYSLHNVESIPLPTGKTK